jgi:glycosyltransferase involved in cell wall biosynthesis
MKICLVHNSYEQRGGEDVVFEQEYANLYRRGHDVIVYRRSNTEIKSPGPLTQIAFVKNSVWSAGTRREFSLLLDRESPDIVHVHNTFFMISPSIYSACKERGIPVIQTLHNFRWICPAYTLYRNGNVCQDCLNGRLWNGIRHGCYRGSKAATAAVALILGWHRIMKTWEENVDCYIALTEFSRQIFIAAGFQANKIVVKPNFVGIDPGPRNGAGKCALFVGRFSAEKGLDTLLRAWERLPIPCPLQIIGDGPERAVMEDHVRRRSIANVTFRGPLDRVETIAAMKEARFLVVPSVWYEGFPMVIAEALACGTPVVCSRLGAMREIVADRRTGLHFNPGDAEDLAQKAAWAWSHPVELFEMGRTARREYERLFTAEQNYISLMEIYHRVVDAGTPHPQPIASSRQSPAFSAR